MFYADANGQKCWLEDVVVDDACRGKGYAKLLVAPVYKESKRLGAKSLNLTSRPVAKRLTNSTPGKDSNYVKLTFIDVKTNGYLHQRNGLPARCIMIVGQLLERIGIEAMKVDLGRIDLYDVPTSRTNARKALDRGLKNSVSNLSLTNDRN